MQQYEIYPFRWWVWWQRDTQLHVLNSISSGC